MHQCSSGYGPYGLDSRPWTTPRQTRSPGDHRLTWTFRRVQPSLPTALSVQASTSLSKALFEISMRQLTFAERHGPMYDIYYVRGARGPAPEIVRLSDPVRLLRTRVSQLFMSSGCRDAS